MDTLDLLDHGALSTIVEHLYSVKDCNALFKVNSRLRSLGTEPATYCAWVFRHYKPRTAWARIFRLWQTWTEADALTSIRYLLARKGLPKDLCLLDKGLIASFYPFKPGLAQTLVSLGAPVGCSVLKATVTNGSDLGPVHLLYQHYTAHFQALHLSLDQRAAPLKAACSQDHHMAVALLLPSFPAAEMALLVDSLLTASAQHGALACMKLLLGHKCSAAAIDTALLESARLGKVDAVLLALQHGADVHAQQDLALREAAEYEDVNHKEVVKVLIGSGADIHVDHDEPLLAASRHGHADVVALLLQHGADIHAQGGAALVLACMHGRADVAKLLLKGGASVNAQQGMPLIRAACQGHSGLVSMLLAHGADVHAQYGSALVSAARGGHLLVVQQLLSAGADASVEENAALCEAVAHGHVPIIHLLLAHGADAHALEDDIESMCRAARHNHWAALDLVLRLPACSSLLDCMGPTLLGVAGLAGHSAVVALLLSMGAAEHCHTRLRGSYSTPLPSTSVYAY